MPATARRGLRRRLAHLRACARISFDLAHSLLRPVVIPPEPEPVLRLSRKAVSGPSVPARPEQLRVVSWNIHRGYQPQRIVDTLAEIVTREAPDLLLLQEVPVGPQGPFWDRDELRELLLGHHVEYAAMHRVHTRSLHYPFDHAGLATLSRTQPIAAAVLQLPNVSRPKLGPAHTVRRIALHTVYSVGQLELGVVNLHLENTTGPTGRRHQIRHLLAAMSAGQGPLLLGGDFNTIFGRLERVKSQLRQQGFSHAAFAPGHRLLPRLDHFFVRGCSALAVRTLRASGSDHAPIAMDLLTRGSRDS